MTGGRGGNASASGTGSNVKYEGLTLSISATGGTGGMGLDNGTGGDGGTAAILAANATGASGTASVSAMQVGGNGGLGFNGGRGADSILLNAPSASTSGNTSLTQGATAGKGGDATGGMPGLAGNAESSLQFIKPGGNALTLDVQSRGGQGGGGTALLGSAGGNALVSAVGGNSGAGAVTVSATAIAGDGGWVTSPGSTGGVGGVVTVGPVSGFSTTGNVTVSATITAGDGGNGFNAGDGLDLTLNNAVSGSTTGSLTLRQTAIAGYAGLSETGGNAGIAGNANSTLTLTNLDCYALIGSVTATGGSRGITGGSGIASISLTGRNAVTVKATATGGGYRPSGALCGQLGTVLGTSTGGGEVTVTGIVNGGGGLSYGTGIAANGAAAILSNAVDGSTTGALSLTQYAYGGAAGATEDGSALAGEARSTLSQVRSVQSLRLEAGATGGRGSDVPNSGIAGTGGSARALVEATNQSGSAFAIGRTQGGAGGAGTVGGTNGLAAGGLGGWAFGSAGATTHGNGNTARTSNQVVGGTGGITGAASLASSGAGGNAESSSTAIAIGDSAAVIYDIARGGDGGASAVLGGNGGNAVSSGYASNNGTNSVTVEVFSYGGSGGSITIGGTAGTGGIGRIGTARGVSTGGNVTVTATVGSGSGGLSYGTTPAGRGTDAALTDAVSGSTPATLTLQQKVIGGSGGTSNGDAGHGADASTSLTYTDTLAQHLVGTIIATGGRGGQSSSATSGSGGNAIASGNLISARDLTLTVSAIGGSAGWAPSQARSGLAGTAILGPVFGKSTGGGDVQVTSSLTAGIGRTASLVSLSNAVDGYTTGRLTLIQTVNGADDGEWKLPGGSASSVLSRTASASVFTVESNATGGRGATGGAATAISSGTNLAGEMIARANAVPGGTMTNPLGADAIASATAVTLGDGHAATALGSAQRNLYRSQFGGSASSSSTARAMGNGKATATDLAIGGLGGAEIAGNASSSAFASNNGNQEVIATATAKGGDGKSASDGGAAWAAASGMSSGGGSVTAKATATAGVGALGRAGGNSFLLNTVSGTTTGNLTLIQSATGGAGGIYDSVPKLAGAGGHASSQLTLLNSTASALSGTVLATGGSAYSSSSGAGSAYASIDLSGLGLVTAIANAVGGEVNAEACVPATASGGAAQLGIVRAVSTGGQNVIAIGTAQGGGGGNGPDAGGGNGASVTLIDQVDGMSTADITLSQTAIGGTAGPISNNLPALAGNAVSRLTSHKSSRSLQVSVSAIAGHGSMLTEAYSTLPTGDGGTADALVTAVNDSGTAVAQASAVGGAARRKWVNANGKGGKATSQANSTSSGSNGASATSSATAGDGVGTVSATPELMGVGGLATSAAIAVANGSGSASATDNAAGGKSATVGGDAISYASATNSGNGAVTATSTASGGTASGWSEPQSGRATSTAIASTVSGRAKADASVTGIQSTAEARATQSAGVVLAASSSSRTLTAGSARSVAGINNAPLRISDITSYASVSALSTATSATDSLLYVVNSPQVRKHLNLGGEGSGPRSNVLGALALGGGQTAGGVSQMLSSSSSFTFDPSLISEKQELILGLLGSQTNAGGFDSLRFRLLNGASTLIDQSFTSPTAAASFFQDRAIDLGPLPAGGPVTLTCTLDVTSGMADQRFYAQVLLANATPNSGGLPGDANKDGKVSFADYQTLERMQGKAGTYSTGDFNGDGWVDHDDFQVVYAYFNQTAATPVAPAGSWAVPSDAVPEPATIGGLLFISATGLCRRRRREVLRARK